MNTRTVHTQSKHTGRAAVVTAALAVSGIGLTAFLVGVSGGSDAENPPAPDVPPSVEMKVPQGVDQRLYELAKKHAAEQRESGPGPDQRLYELAEQYAEMRAQRQPAPGPDLRLYELAKKHAAQQEQETVPGPDQRLYQLAEQYAEMRAQR
jgi:hypothetical protein